MNTKLFMILLGFCFFTIALFDLYRNGWGVINGWFSVMSPVGKMSTICFAIILLVLIGSQFFKRK